MAQYIEKDAALAEIKKLEKLYCYDSVTTGGRIAKSVFISINDVFNSLEVKEVDLEVELANYNREYVDENGFFNTEHFAKHFFELGMRVNNPITAADRGMAEEIIINLKRVEKDYRIDLTREMEWLRNKVKKG